MLQSALGNAMVEAKCIPIWPLLGTKAEGLKNVNRH